MSKSFNDETKYLKKYGEDTGIKQPRKSDLVKIRNHSIIDGFEFLYIEKEYFKGKFGYYRVYTLEEDGRFFPYMGATSDVYDVLFKDGRAGGFTRILQIREE